MRREEQTLFLDLGVQNLRYVSAKRLDALQQLGIHTVRDLLLHVPFRYNDFSDLCSIREAALGKKHSILGVVDEIHQKQPRPKLKITEVSILDGSGVLYATWFNQPWLAKNLAPGTQVLLLGKVEHSYGFKRMTNPLLTILEEAGNEAERQSAQMELTESETRATPKLHKKPMLAQLPSNAAALELADRSVIMPVYSANANVSSAWIARIIKAALSDLPALFDPLMPALRIKLDLMSLQGALRELHQPSSQEARFSARRRLAFDEVFYLMLHMKKQRMRTRSIAPSYIHPPSGPAITRLPELLPFTLTSDQVAAIKEITDSMAQNAAMDRLLIGDVGSGKTVVAAHALALAYDAGYQAAMMAPTEVLVQQYATKLGPLFDELGIPWAQLSSSTPAEARRTLLAQLAAGKITVLLGTHALIEPDVVFKDLSLVVIDEQHRFGVKQRDMLRAKSPGSDALMMTATPIPRSLALVLYGDLLPTYIYARPQTATVTTQVLDRSRIGEAYDVIHQELALGYQAYIICPLITSQATAAHGDGAMQTQESTGFDAEVPLIDLFTDISLVDDSQAIRAAEHEADFLQRSVFPEHTVSLLTGRMPPQKKRSIMDRFRAGEIDVLVSTTVVEVGVDIPNATVMIIEDADRFGITQLHQLRGRIGRGAWDGSLFLTTRTRNEDTLARLRLLERISNGFTLAEADLSLRREGDILGSRQHGAAILKLVKVLEDAKLIAAANAEATALLTSDSELSAPECAYLLHELRMRFPTDDEVDTCA